MATNKKERKKEKMKNNKGITLIALIITIIVMLILVAVTVAVVVNSDLIGTTQKSTQDYKAKEEGERNIAGFNVIVNGEGEKVTHQSPEPKTKLDEGKTVRLFTN